MVREFPGGEITETQPARRPLQESRCEKKTQSNMVPGGMVRNGQRGTSQIKKKKSEVGERERNFKEGTYMRRVFMSLQNTSTCLPQASRDGGHSHFPDEDTEAQRDEGHTLAQGHTLSKLH